MVLSKEALNVIGKKLMIWFIKAETVTKKIITVYTMDVILVSAILILTGSLYKWELEKKECMQLSYQSAK